MTKQYFFIIDNKKYDLTSFIPKHPGGPDICYFSGYDISVHYKMLHGKEFNHIRMKEYLVEDNVNKTQDPLLTSKISPFGKIVIDRVREEMGETSFYADKVIFHFLLFNKINLHHLYFLKNFFLNFKQF